MTVSSYQLTFSEKLHLERLELEFNNSFKLKGNTPFEMKLSFEDYDFLRSWVFLLSRNYVVFCQFKEGLKYSQIGPSRYGGGNRCKLIKITGEDLRLHIGYIRQNTL